MDLKSLINTEDGKKEKRSPRPSTGTIAQTPPPSRAIGQAPATAGQGSVSHNHTPHYGPPATTPVQAPQAYGMTPLFTPNRSPGSAQYPYPAQAAQSPAAAPPYQQYRPQDLHAATTPYGRPHSHGNPFPAPPPPSAFSAGGAPNSYSSSSVSPTPSSHHSHTPHSVRQSPGATLSHASYVQHPYQHSQPNTPFPAPPLVSQRSTGYPDPQSSFNQRTLSGTSNGVHSSSPAPQPHGLTNFTGSPLAYNRPSPHLRRTSEYLSHIERDRSQSISPKTTVLPRQSSLDSRQSSQPNIHGDRSMSQASGPPGSTPSDHVTYVHPPGTAQIQHPNYPHVASEVPQLPPQLLHQTSGPSDTHLSPNADPSLSANDRQGSNPVIQHRTEKIPMSHLLTPANAPIPATHDPTITSTDPSRRTQQGSSDFTRPSPMSRQLNNSESGFAHAHSTDLSQHDQSHGMETSMASENAWSQMTSEKRRSAPDVDMNREDDYDSAMSMRASKASLKRPADAEMGAEPPQKQQKLSRKMPRPIWAQLSPQNPRYNPREQANGKSNSPMAQQHPTKTRPPIQSNGTPLQEGNGKQDAVHVDEDKPWLNNPPLDFDLINARRALGKWEKTIKWQTPYPDMLKAVQDWLWMQLDQLQDIGTDPSEGTVEIEAKIGTLLREDSTERCNYPVATATVIRPEANHRFHFESRMTGAEHKDMNAFLNDTIKASMVPGRAQMTYRHLHETDYFRALSAEGIGALPAAIRNRPQLGREPRLRTTMEHFRDPNKEPKLKARIVKITLAHLHIFNPQHNYDCRISINLEVNLNAFDPATITIDPKSSGRPDPAPRVKDRVSYKHLAYQIDLTKVEMGGMEPTYELELEVDAALLRQQMALAKQGRLHAFGDVVAGFLDNATFLMRQRPS